MATRCLPYVIAILSLTAIIGGFESTKLHEASRALSLARATQIELAGQLFGLACMIAWALADRSIWALVAGALGAAVAAYAPEPRLAGGRRRTAGAGKTPPRARSSPSADGSSPPRCSASW